MTPDDDLTRRLEALSEPPAVELAGPAAAQARGRQLHRRRNALVSGTAAVVLLASGGLLVSALDGEGGRDRLDSVAAPQVSASPSSGPSPSASPSTSPSPSASPSTSPSPSVPPSPTTASSPVPRRSAAPPSAPVPPDPPASPAAPAPAVPLSWVERALLDPVTAAAHEYPGWEVVTRAPAPGPQFDPCGTGTFPQSGALVEGGERSMRAIRTNGTKNSALTQEVLRYTGDTQARAAFEEYVTGVRGCLQGKAKIVYSVDGERMLVSLPVCAERGEAPTLDCPGATYAMVVRSGAGLTVVRYDMGTAYDPGTEARSLVEGVAGRLDAAAG